MSESADPRELLVHPDEREHVLSLLQRAVRRGLLSIDEFATRSEAALAATTRGQLNAVLAGLPGIRAAPDRLELVGWCTHPVSREGLWAVPCELVVRARWTTVDLDFATAHFLDDQVRLELEITGGPVRLRLPAAAGVTLSGLTVAWGATVLDRRPEPLRHGQPQLVISGSIRGAPLTLDGPR